MDGRGNFRIWMSRWKVGLFIFVRWWTGPRTSKYVLTRRDGAGATYAYVMRFGVWVRRNEGCKVEDGLQRTVSVLGGIRGGDDGWPKKANASALSAFINRLM